jgi:PAS domain S-box-containing protein
MADNVAATILVVDDNPPTRYSTSRVLRAAGFAVLEAGTGHEAIARTKSDPDLIILDVNLPDIDGFEVCRRIRESPRTARTPVIHLSATFVNDDYKVRGLDAGADGYLTHPVEPPVLIATVNAFLRARQAEEAMRRSEAKFKAVFQNALNGIALLSDGMIYLDVNPAVCATLGRDRHDIIGRHISAFLPSDSEAIVPDVDRSLRESGLWRGAFPMLNASGSEVYLEWSIALQAEPATLLAVTTDISERRAAEAERERLLASERAARGEAERANRLKDEFLAAISHELRTPLNAILGWTRLLGQRSHEDHPDLTQGLEAIERNVRVQTQLISELLDVSRITSGKLLLELQWFDPKAAIDASLGAFSAAAQAKRVEIQVDTSREVGQILWDQARFQQVVNNLIDNAIKFSEPGGMIQLSTSGSEDAIELTISDTGCGIARQFLPHVFDRFRQEDASTRRRHGGLGLGLAIVKQLVEAHQGSISVFSAGEGKGTTFVVRLPRLRDGAVAEQMGLPTPRSLEGARILVVEDDQDARHLVSRLLQDFGAEVREASSVARAKTTLQSFKPDLIISDISMPGEDGYDLIRYLRAPGSDFADVPAIALTAFARDEDRNRVLDSGYQHHMAKPVETLKLVELAGALTEQASRRH